jgi:hypothetical protein
MLERNDRRFIFKGFALPFWLKASGNWRFYPMPINYLEAELKSFSLSELS